MGLHAISARSGGRCDAHSGHEIRRRPPPPSRVARPQQPAAPASSSRQAYSRRLNGYGRSFWLQNTSHVRLGAAQVHDLAHARVDDGQRGRELACRAVDGDFRPGLDLPLHRPRDFLLHPDLAHTRRARLRMEGRRLQLGEPGDELAVGAARGLGPVRADDLLLPHGARLRRDQLRLHHRPQARQQRHLHRGDAGRALLGQRGHLRPRPEDDLIAGVEGHHHRDAHPGTSPGRAGNRVSPPGQLLRGANECSPYPACLGRDREHRPDRQQLPLL